MQLLSATLTGRLPCTFTIDGQFGIDGRPPMCAEPAVWWEQDEDGQPVLWCRGHYRGISEDIAGMTAATPPRA